MSNLSQGDSGIFFDIPSLNKNSGWIKDTKHNFTGLAPNTNYTVSVKARNQQSVETTPFTINALTSAMGFAITSREIQDTDNDDLGDAVKLILNLPVNDSTVNAQDFAVDGNPGSSLLTNVPGDSANDGILHIGVGNQVPGDATPAVQYTGNALQSNDGQTLTSELAALNAADKVAPVIESLSVGSFNGETVIRVFFSEDVSAATVDDPLLWQVEAPLGTALPVASSSLNSKTLTLIVPVEISNAPLLSVSALNVEDLVGNIRSPLSKTTNDILNNSYSFKVIEDEQRWRAEGPAVHSSAEIVLLFDREMNSDSLRAQSAIAVYRIQDKSLKAVWEIQWMLQSPILMLITMTLWTSQTLEFQLKILRFIFLTKT